MPQAAFRRDKRMSFGGGTIVAESDTHAVAEGEQGSDQRHCHLTISPDPRALPLLVRYQ